MTWGCVIKYRTSAHLWKTCHIWEVSPYMGSLPIYGKSPRIWGVSPQVVRLPVPHPTPPSDSACSGRGPPSNFGRGLGAGGNLRANLLKRTGWGGVGRERRARQAGQAGQGQGWGGEGGQKPNVFPLEHDLLLLD